VLKLQKVDFILFYVYFYLFSSFELRVRHKLTLFLSLLPPSCIVVPIRELANKHLFTSAISITPLSMTQIPSNMKMDIDYDSIKKRSALLSKNSLRIFSISSSTLFVLYYQYMEINNDLPDIESQEPIDSSQLSYKENVEVGSSVSKTADNLSPKKSQHVNNEASALKSTPNPQDKGIPNNSFISHSFQDMINIQLLYDINQVTE